MSAPNGDRIPGVRDDDLAALFAATRPADGGAARLQARIMAAIAAAPARVDEPLPVLRLAGALACAALFGIGLGAMLPLASPPDAVEIALLGTFSGDLGPELP